MLQAPGPGATAPEQFFVGHTEGAGSVHVMLHGAHAMRDHNHGRMDRNVLVIDQVVEEAGKPPRRRTWRLVHTAPNRFTGTISDAAGPVTGDVAGNVLHLRYRSAVDSVAVEQWITIQPGSRTAHNRMTFRKFGMSVGSVEEIIRRVD